MLPRMGDDALAVIERSLTADGLRAAVVTMPSAPGGIKLWLDEGFALWALREGEDGSYWAYSVLDGEGEVVDYGVTALRNDADPEVVADVIANYPYELNDASDFTADQKRAVIQSVGGTSD